MKKHPIITAAVGLTLAVAATAVTFGAGAPLIAAVGLVAGQVALGLGVAATGVDVAVAANDCASKSGCQGADFVALGFDTVSFGAGGILG